MSPPAPALSQPRPDAIVIGAGVVGCSVAWHLARLGARHVLVLDRGAIGSGTSAMSSGILRTHYSVPQNVELAARSWRFFERFAEELEDHEASAGLVRCGYLIATPEGSACEALRASLAAQAARGIEVHMLDARQAHDRLPIARFDEHNAALVGFEPQAGFADATLTATSFARAARRRGVRFAEGTAVTGLAVAGSRVQGVLTAAGRIDAAVVVSVQNIWAGELAGWLRGAAGIEIEIPLVPERHRVLALAGPAPYTSEMPVFKDLASPGLLYARSYGRSQMLVSEGTSGEVLGGPDTTPGEVSLDQVAEIGAQVAERFPGWENAALASSWTGVYDVTPDWNPVLGRLPGIEGLVVGFGFSGHGFKLSPAVGEVLAEAALGLPTTVSLEPYALERFARGTLLLGRYGAGAVS